MWYLIRSFRYQRTYSYILYILCIIVVYFRFFLNRQHDFDDLPTQHIATQNIKRVLVLIIVYDFFKSYLKVSGNNYNFWSSRKIVTNFNDHFYKICSAVYYGWDAIISVFGKTEYIIIVLFYGRHFWFNLNLVIRFTSYCFGYT